MNGRKTLAIVLGSIVILGLSVGATLGVAATTATDAPADSTGSDLTAVQDEGNQTDNQTQERIPITEAMEAAASETEDQNGTVVGAEVGQTGGLLDFGEDDESVYTVDVLLANGTHIEVAVNATNGSVVQTDEQQEGFLEGIFGEDDVPDRPLNLSAMYNATEAVELAQNETVENESMENVTAENTTVTSVKLNERDDTLVYEVQMQTGDDNEITVVVAAMKDGEGVIAIENGNGGM